MCVSVCVRECIDHMVSNLQEACIQPQCFQVKTRSMFEVK